MQSTNWKEIAELIGIAAIVASLVFVGLQLRQDQDIARYEGASDYYDTTIAYAGAIIENAGIWREGLEGLQFDDPNQEVKFQALAYMAHRKFAGIYSRDERIDGGRRQNAITRQFASELYTFPGLRRTFLSRCEKQYSMGLSPQFCIDVLEKLRLIDSGQISPPQGVHYIP